MVNFICTSPKGNVKSIVEHSLTNRSIFVFYFKSFDLGLFGLAEILDFQFSSLGFGTIGL